MVSADEVSFCLAGFDALDMTARCPRPRSDRFAITSHGPRNLFARCRAHRSSSSGRRRAERRYPVDLAPDHNGPDGSSRSVGRGDGHNPGRLAGEQGGEARADRDGVMLVASDERRRAGDQQATKVLVAPPLEIRPRRSLPLLEWLRGVRPSQAANCTRRQPSRQSWSAC